MFRIGKLFRVGEPPIIIENWPIPTTVKTEGLITRILKKIAPGHYRQKQKAEELKKRIDQLEKLRKRDRVLGILTGLSGGTLAAAGVYGIKRLQAARRAKAKAAQVRRAIGKAILAAGLGYGAGTLYKHLRNKKRPGSTVVSSLGAQWRL